MLLGPSGSGKSTLLNIIGGIDNADSGYININGDKLEDMSEKKLTQYRRKHLGYVFQMYNLIANLNVKENIEVGAYLSDNALDIDELLHTLGLYEHRYKLPNQLSGGQQQRVSIGRAIVKNPDILLCDEPTGALDYNTSKEILKLIEDDLYNTIIVLAKQMQHGLFELSACEERVYDKIQDIELKGFIDRVDLYQNYLKVIDYKSSNKELNLELARLGFNMQMLIYLEMLSKNKNYDKGAVLYFNTKKRMLKSEISILEKQDPESFFKLYKMDGYCVDDTYLEIDHEMEQESDIIKIKLKKDGSPYSNAKIISHDELDILLQEITLHIQSLYQQMITGDIRIYPTRSDNPNIDMHINPCRFCHYKAICNYDIFYNEDHQIELGGQNEER